MFVLLVDESTYIATFAIRKHHLSCQPSSAQWHYSLCHCFCIGDWAQNALTPLVSKYYRYPTRYGLNMGVRVYRVVALFPHSPRVMRSVYYLPLPRSRHTPLLSSSIYSRSCRLHVIQTVRWGGALAAYGLHHSASTPRPCMDAATTKILYSVIRRYELSTGTLSTGGLVYSARKLLAVRDALKLVAVHVRRGAVLPIRFGCF
ncbi:hypothetical protein JB92DRAFT_894156 [Gautieria morchelliformis]|nr:hypothetical protein JB92DRAFT_894156 [Gautieria morchelliformis]